MTVDLERTQTEFLIKVPLTVDLSLIQSLIDDLQFYEIKSRSKATDEDIQKLSKQVKSNWSPEVKARLKELDEFKDLNF
jgi:hypothetical protein